MILKGCALEVRLKLFIKSDMWKRLDPRLFAYKKYAAHFRIRALLRLSPLNGF